MDRLAKIYVKEIVRVHRVPVSLTSDKDTKFTSLFLKSLLKAMGTQLKYVVDPSHVLHHEILHIKLEVTYDEKPLRIIDQKDKKLRSRTILMVKVLWRSHAEGEATCELESALRDNIPTYSMFRGRNFCKGVGL